MSKKSTDMFPPARFPNHLCDLYGQYIGFGAGTSVSGVSIEKTALFDGDAQNLSRSQGSGSAGTWTWAAWLYKTHSTNQVFLNFGTGGAEGQLGWAATDKMYCYDGATTVFLTTQVFRDQGWYHIHVAYNTSESGTDKVKLSVNGTLVTVFDTDNRSSANDFEDCNTSSQTTYVGNNSGTSDGVYFRGYMAQACMIDGSAVAASSFIETSTDGYVTPKADADIKALADAGASANSYFLSNATALSSNMTTFVDSGNTGHTITTGGNATHSPLGQKIDNSVIYVDGTTDYISVAPSGHSDFTFGTGDWCVEGWFLRKALSGTGNISYIFDFRYASNDDDRPYAYIDGSNDIQWGMDNSGNKITSSSSISLGAWFHLAIARSSGTTTMYLNGSSVGTWSDSTDYAVGRPWFFEYPQSNAYCFNGYATELRISKGAARYTGTFTPSTTAFTSDSSTSLLVHSDKSFGVANDDSTHLNHFVNNGTVTTANHTPTHIEALWNPYFKNSSAGSPTLTNGNKTIQVSSTSEVRVGQNLIIPTVGKWIMGVSQAAVDDTGKAFGIWTTLTQTTGFPSVTGLGGWHVTTSTNAYQCDGTHIVNITTAVGTPQTADQFWICADVDNGKIFFGFWDNSASSISWYAADGGTDGNPATGDNPSQSIDVGGATFGGTGYNDKTFTLVEEADIPFTVPSGYKFLNTTNIASAIKPSESQLSDHFAIKLFTGDGGASKALTFGGTNNMQPDFVWVKDRGISSSQQVVDSLRGATKEMITNGAGGESTNADGLLSFDSDGFTVGADGWWNGSGNSLFALCLKAGGAPTATNSEAQGDPPTSGSYMIDGVASSADTIGTADITKLSVNTKFGFSCGLYNGSNSDTTLQTGLTDCKMIIIKRTNDTYNWAVWHEGLTDDYSLFLNTNASQANNSYFDTSENTSTLFHLEGNSNATSIASGTFVFYAFAESPYISIGSYEGNANADGTFIVTEGSAGPITPKLVFIKSMDHTQSWFLRDTARNPSNPITKDLYPDLNNGEATGTSMDIVKGGIKQRVSSDSNSANTYVYMAIGHPIINTDGLIRQGR